MGKSDQGVAAGKSRYQVIPRTLVFVTCGDRVLLLKGGPHKRLWAGRYNGLGGHLEPGEDVYAGALREVQEEAGLEIRELKLRAVVHADAGDPLTGVLFFVFSAETDHAEDGISSEGLLEWHPLDRLPLDLMVEDLPILLPRVLAAPPAVLFAAYSYDNQDRLVIRFAKSS